MGAISERTRLLSLCAASFEGGLSDASRPQPICARRARLRSVDRTDGLPRFDRAKSKTCIRSWMPLASPFVVSNDEEEAGWLALLTKAGAAVSARTWASMSCWQSRPLAL